MSSNFTRAAFFDQINSSFRLPLAESGAITLDLVEVSEVRTDGKQETFSAEFRGPGQVLLPQRIHRLEHPMMGTLDLFLVPIRKDNAGIYYEAVFNRLLPSS